MEILQKYFIKTRCKTIRDYDLREIFIWSDVILQESYAISVIIWCYDCSPWVMNTFLDRDAT